MAAHCLELFCELTLLTENDVLCLTSLVSAASWFALRCFRQRGCWSDWRIMNVDGFERKLSFYSKDCECAFPGG